MPRLLTMPCAVPRSHNPAAVPPTMMPKLPSTAPTIHHAIERPPTRNPTEKRMGEAWIPNEIPGMGSVATSDGIMPSTSRRIAQSPANAIDPKSLRPVDPPAVLASKVSAAAVPMGYSKSESSTNRLRMSAVHTRPNSVPASATASISCQDTSSAKPRIQIPGMVNARPPATMEPADMMTCVIFASLRLVWPSARKSTRAVIDVKMVGHGNAPILSAV